MSALMSTRASLRLPRRDVATSGRNLSSGGAARRPILCQRLLRYHRTLRSGFRDKLKAEAATPTTESLKTGEEGDDGTDDKDNKAESLETSAVQSEDSKSETTISTDEPSKAAVETEDVSQKRSFLKPVDKEILKMFLPSVANIMLVPLSGAVDLLWVGRMNSSIALAGQSAGMQVFNSVHCFVVFLPALVTPLVAKTYASGNIEEMQRHIGEALFVAVFLGIIGGITMYLFHANVAEFLVGLPQGSVISADASAYIRGRSLGFLPSSCAAVFFATFRGMTKVSTGLKVMIATQLINASLDPLLIFGIPMLGISGFGVGGAALATSISEMFCITAFIVMLQKSEMLPMKKLIRVPDFRSFRSMLLSGGTMQLRFLLLRLKDVYATRAVLAIGAAGTAAAANAITQQMFQLGGAVALGLGMTCSVMVPRALHKKEGGGEEAAKEMTERVLSWSMVVGAGVALLQLAALPLLGVFSSLPEVRNAAVTPCIIAALVQIINAIMLCGEGIVRGHRAFDQLLWASLVAASGFIFCLQYFSLSLSGVWSCVAVATALQMVYLLHSPFVTGKWTTKRKELVVTPAS